MFLSAGPRGGMSMNALCGYCRSEFNISIVSSERLSTHCDPARQKEIYGIDEAEFPPHTYPKFKKPEYVESFEGVLLKGCPDPNCDHSHGPLHNLVIVPKCHHKEPAVVVSYRKGTGQLWLSCPVCAKPILAVQVASKNDWASALRFAADIVEHTEGYSTVEIADKLRKAAITYDHLADAERKP